MKLQVNGNEREVVEGITLATLLEAMVVSGRVAVEVNAEVVRRALHATHALHEGDRVEIVTFVGGG